MHDLDNSDENFSADELDIHYPLDKPQNERTGRLQPVVRDSKTPGRSTGPVTPNGKAKSSMNALTHGCRSEKSVLPHEDPAEFGFTVQIWLDAYQPEDPVAETLVLDTAKAHWVFKRNQTYYDQIASRLPMDPWHWTDENLKLYDKFTRYKTTAERSFYRAFNTLETHYKRKDDRAAQTEKARALVAKASMEWAKRKSERAIDKLKTMQMVEVLVNDRGDCVTTYKPTNEQITARFTTLDEPPLFLTRYILFSFGVPRAYDWTNPNDVQRREPTYGVQHFTYSDWLKQIEAEQLAPTGHLVPSATVLVHDPD
jgi:hypothetical protein